MEPELIEKIESYLDGEIDLLILESFASNYPIESLQSEIEWVQDMQIVIEAEGLENQLGQLINNNIHQLPTPQTKRIPLWTTLGIAASILLLVGFFFFLQPNKYEKLYSKYKYVDPGLPTLMSETEQYTLYDAMTFYSEENYLESLIRLESIDNEVKIANDTIQYYLGLCRLYTGNESGGISLLKTISDNKQSVFSEKATWTLCLNLLKQKKLSDLKAQLEIISSNNKHLFNKEAIQLKSELF